MCCRSFTGPKSDIPIPETGYTVISSNTIPCDLFLSVAHSYSESEVSLRQHSTSQPPSVSSLTSGQYTGPPRPKFTDTNLIGCYAGTGALSTIYTFTSGDYLPRGTGTDYIEASSSEVRTIACSDFMTLPYVNPTVALSYQKSPICTSQIQWEHEHPDAPTGYGEGPPGLWNNRQVGDPFECCGGCYFQLPTVSILYFTTTPTMQCSKGNATITSFSSPSAVSGKLDKRAVPLVNATNNVIVDGSTLTFPSIYLVVEGRVSVTDKCGVRGMVHNNPTIAIPPHGLSELSFYNGYQPAEGYKTLPYDPAIPAGCRTYGFSNPHITSKWYQVNDNSSSIRTSTMWSPGYPYNPFLVPPQQLIDLDSAWKTCQYWSSFGNQYGQLTYGAFDPPRLLNPETAMAPSSTPAGPTTTEILPGKTPDPTAQPGAKSMPDAPRVTPNTLGGIEPAGHSTFADPDPVAATVVPASHGTSQDSSAQAPQHSAFLVPAPSLSALGPLPGHSSLSSVADSKPTDPAAGNPQMEGLPDLGPHSSTSQDLAPPLTTTIQLGHQTNTVRTTIQLESHANEQDASPMSSQVESQGGQQYAPQISIQVEGHVDKQSAAPISIQIESHGNQQGAQQASIQIQSHVDEDEHSAAAATIQIPSPTSGPLNSPGLGGLIYSAIGYLNPAPSLIPAADPAPSLGNTVADPSIGTAAGRLLTVLDPSAVLIAGSTLTPGGARLTVSGIPIGQAPFGNLLVDSGPVSQTPPVLTIAGHAVSANPTSFNIAGIPIKAGGPGVTISGTAVTLDGSGNLVIVGSTPTLSMAVSTALPQHVFTIGGQSFTANPSVFSAVGTTVSAGGPGVTINGTPVSLNPSGSLILGTNKIALVGSSIVPVDSSTDDPSFNAAAGAGAGVVSQQTGASSGTLALTTAGIGSGPSVGDGGLTKSGLEYSKDSLTSASNALTAAGDGESDPSTSISTAGVVSETNATTSVTSTSNSNSGVVGGINTAASGSDRASGTPSATPSGGSSKASGDLGLLRVTATFIAIGMAMVFL